MIEKTEAARLAAAINALRPEWPAQSLLTFIGQNLQSRAYRDAVVALAWVAADPQSVTPARVLENGPWWKATQAQAGTVSAIAMRCPDHPAECAWDCKPCSEDVADISAGLARVRAAMKDAPPPPRAAHPTPTIHDLAANRDRADHQDQS
jgi:hypothetical protein